jgi:hypothetical protein
VAVRQCRAAAKTRTGVRRAARACFHVPGTIARFPGWENRPLAIEICRCFSKKTWTNW